MRAGRWELAETYARGTLELTLGTDLWNAEAAGRWTARVRRLRTSAASRSPAGTPRPAAGRRRSSATSRSRRAAAHVLGFLALSLGDADAAVRHLAPLREAEERLQLREPAEFCIAPDLAEALILAGDLDARARGAGGARGARARRSAARGRSPPACAAAG